MIILIDGYNLLKSMSSDQRTDDTEREWFLKQLGRYASRKHHTLIVVFDAGPCEWTMVEKKNGLEICFSGRFKDADQVLMDLIELHKGMQVILVSSDREVADYAHTNSVPSIASQDFWMLVMQAINEERQHVAPCEVSVTLETEQDDLDAIMEEGSRQVPIKEADIVRPDAVSSKRLSRIERKLYEILKKL